MGYPLSILADEAPTLECRGNSQAVLSGFFCIVVVICAMPPSFEWIYNATATQLPHCYITAKT